ncbi:hypothetical protein J2S98_004190 [Arthrobacter oryzae]|nr:hypothetical protein [Arthrobacter oryzae]
MPDDVDGGGGVINARRKGAYGDIDQLAEPKSDILDIGALIPGFDSCL